MGQEATITLNVMDADHLAVVRALAQLPFAPERQARSLYWRGWAIADIARELDIAPTTIYSWRNVQKWDDFPALKRMEEETFIRWSVLMHKAKKSGAEFKELDAISRQMLTFARIRRFQEPDGNTGDLVEGIATRAKAPRKKPKQNHFTEEQVAKLRDLLEKTVYEYQADWWENCTRRTRMILKSRQIGATYYFALEALVMALETGHNQIFLSASKAQAHIFRIYMAQFAANVGVTLKGDPMLLTSDLVEEGNFKIEVHFLGTNARTAQGYHGDFYFDEFFWVYGFEALNKVASGMATHKKWRKTYFSTPSTVAHAAYPYWTGERRNRHRKKADQLNIDVSHAGLKDGRLCEDKVWRHIVTVEDAQSGGCDLFDIDELRDEYPPDEFVNLFLCQFVDDSQSAFKFNDLVRCLCDSWVEWKGDFEPHSDRPAGNRAVWAGYDPQESEDGDNAALVIALPPTKPGEKFRVLEAHQLRGLDFQQQSEFIRAVFARYEVSYFGIDATGVGAGVYQLVRDWYPRVTKIEYSLEEKARMVMKAQNVIRTGRLKFDAGWTHVVQAFMGIKRTLTRGGGRVTYTAGRGGDVGHSDLAWAIMHILDNEPLDGSTKKRGSAEIIGGDDR